ncbi:MAG: sigma-70 family RNA polymerase sigma factor [Ilumatobacteraceae bacterium]
MAEDLVHDAFLGVLSAWKRGRVPELSGAILTVAVRQRFLDGIRGQRRRERRETLASARDVHVPGDPDGSGAIGMLGVLRSLPPRHRLALVMRYVDDLSIEEVASQLGVSTNAAESLLARARRDARRLLERGNQ